MSEEEIKNQKKKIAELEAEIEVKKEEKERFIVEMKKIWIQTGFFETIEKIKPALVDKEKYHLDKLVGELFRVFCRPKSLHKDEVEFYVENQSNYQRILDYPIEHKRIQLILQWLFEHNHETWLGLKKAVIINKELEYMKEDEFIDYVDKTMGFRLDDIILLKSISSYEDYLKLDKTSKKRIQSIVCRDFYPNVPKSSISIDQTIKEMFDQHKRRNEQILREKMKEEKKIEAKSFVSLSLTLPQLLQILKNYDSHDLQTIKIIRDCENKINKK